MEPSTIAPATTTDIRTCESPKSTLIPLLRPEANMDVVDSVQNCTSGTLKVSNKICIILANCSVVVGCVNNITVCSSGAIRSSL